VWTIAKKLVCFTATRAVAMATNPGWGAEFTRRFCVFGYMRCDTRRSPRRMSCCGYCYTIARPGLCCSDHITVIHTLSPHGIGVGYLISISWGAFLGVIVSPLAKTILAKPIAVTLQAHRARRAKICHAGATLEPNWSAKLPVRRGYGSMW
jgi:hypothetical protein